MKSLCVLSLLLGLVVCAPDVQKCGRSWYAPAPQNDRIMYGEDAVKGAWPWTVSMQMLDWDEEWRHEGGGSIINDEWLVTAAHVFDASREKANWKLYSGDHEINTTRDETDGYRHTLHEIDTLVIYPTYVDEYHPGDIALIKVTPKFNFTKQVQPICLPKAEDVFDEFDPSCYAAGWGFTHGVENENILQQVHSEIRNLELCKDEHNARDDGAVHEDSICFGDGRKGTCKGDSGGPLMCKRRSRWTLAGVTSWGNTYCIEQPGVFTRTVAYLDWIEQHTGGNPDEARR